MPTGQTHIDKSPLRLPPGDSRLCLVDNSTKHQKVWVYFGSELKKEPRRHGSRSRRQRLLGIAVGEQGRMSACNSLLSPVTHPRIPSHRLMLPTVRADPPFSVLKLSESTIITASRGVFLGDLNPDKLTVEIDHHIRYNSLFTVSFVYSKFSVPAHLTPFCLLLPQKRLTRRPLPTNTVPSKT